MGYLMTKFAAMLGNLSVVTEAEPGEVKAEAGYEVKKSLVHVHSRPPLRCLLMNSPRPNTTDIHLVSAKSITVRNVAIRNDVKAASLGHNGATATRILNTRAARQNRIIRSATIRLEGALPQLQAAQCHCNTAPLPTRRYRSIGRAYECWLLVNGKSWPLSYQESSLHTATRQRPNRAAHRCKPGHSTYAILFAERLTLMFEGS